MSKRAGSSADEALIDEDRVLAAVEARRQSILEHAATVSISTLLGWLAADLRLPSDAALRPHRRAIRRRGMQILEDQVSWPMEGGLD